MEEQKEAQLEEPLSQIIRLEYEDSQEERLDLYLSRMTGATSRTYLQKLIKEGCVKVNGSVIRIKKEKLKSGDIITLELPPSEPLALEAQAIPLDILYEDSALLVINKASGMVVHPAPGSSSGTLVHALLHHCGSQLSGINGVSRPGIVHRLDKDTSGLMMVAKNGRWQKS